MSGLLAASLVGIAPLATLVALSGAATTREFWTTRSAP